jgi:hypothetical protein
MWDRPAFEKWHQDRGRAWTSAIAGILGAATGAPGSGNGLLSKVFGDEEATTTPGSPGQAGAFLSRFPGAAAGYGGAVGGNGAQVTGQTKGNGFWKNLVSGAQRGMDFADRYLTPEGRAIERQRADEREDLNYRYGLQRIAAAEDYAAREQLYDKQQTARQRAAESKSQAKTDAARSLASQFFGEGVSPQVGAGGSSSASSSDQGEYYYPDTRVGQRKETGVPAVQGPALGAGTGASGELAQRAQILDADYSRLMRHRSVLADRMDAIKSGNLVLTVDQMRAVEKDWMAAQQDESEAQQKLMDIYEEQSVQQELEADAESTDLFIAADAQQALENQRRYGESAARARERVEETKRYTAAHGPFNDGQLRFLSAMQAPGEHAAIKRLMDNYRKGSVSVPVFLPRDKEAGITKQATGEDGKPLFREEKLSITDLHEAQSYIQTMNQIEMEAGRPSSSITDQELLRHLMNANAVGSPELAAPIQRAIQHRQAQTQQRQRVAQSAFEVAAEMAKTPEESRAMLEEAAQRYGFASVEEMNAIAQGVQ